MNTTNPITLISNSVIKNQAIKNLGAAEAKPQAQEAAPLKSHKDLSKLSLLSGSSRTSTETSFAKTEKQAEGSANVWQAVSGSKETIDKGAAEEATESFTEATVQEDIKADNADKQAKETEKLTASVKPEAEKLSESQVNNAWNLS